ncbi:aspartate 1-decarboxylase [Gammaproteobacteria bacterium]|jgi:aspartate 1-decarboxylase|nr:aspartate 1-decarboxylase [Gammaproteobacteria bacterium]MBT7522962.1 aspartate 1-decarboxylase [Gammaproteobacteria bacterium]MBT7814602.1 aspartate 1-decarboxylase [Gammaproteobacteria bacterium]MDA9896377.1 aspartate 1-decarboxylase [Gammaproteobacteria bacterium]MDC3386524.1 aspartate 1-decarboxylase [Gammaproteobacteria bacterium]|tara:strand:+ start:492 stop:872 length:381 start_codon:yes stop_codon:yes gene_type:complete
MNLTFLKSKLHGARVTHSELNYDGSCAIDSDILAQASIYEYERIEIYNVTNGERFSTYTILAEPGSGIISVNGAAAHKANPGDKLVIASYIDVQEDQIKKHSPILVYLDANNKIIKKTASIAMQLV